jgi:hypothetical protein
MQQPSDKMYKEEAALLKAVIRWLEPQQRDGIKVIRICDIYHSGYSDLFICARGRFVVAELKDDTGTASPHQELFIEEMEAAGATGGVCRTVKEVSDLIDKAVYCQCGYTESKYCPHCGKEIRR